MYYNFIGIDISKKTFTVGQYGIQVTKNFENTAQGFREFCKEYKNALSNCLVVLETTGGYEMELTKFLLKKEISLHRADTRKVKYFIRSLGKSAKSDTIDALGLAQYGYERHQSLTLFSIKFDNQAILQQLVQRRLDLKKLLVQEKNRKQAPNQDRRIVTCCNTMIKAIEKQIKALDKEIQDYIETSPREKEKQKILEEIAGIGKGISGCLLALLPELGKINRRAIASLIGVAPHPYESGQMIAYRSTKGGRKNVRCILFMAAMTAARSKGRLGEFYKGMLNRGKKKMVALTALMRKIIVIANAKLSDWYKVQSLPC